MPRDFKWWVVPHLRDEDVKYEYGGVKTVRGFNRGVCNRRRVMCFVRV